MTQGPIQLRIGVLDDDPSVAQLNSLCLIAMGHFAAHYFSVPSMMNDLAYQNFNAYLLDWSVGDVTARNLIAALRAVDDNAPIVVLSGHAAGSNDLCGRNIALAAKELRFIAFQKPTHIPHIAATLISAMPEARRKVA